MNTSNQLGPYPKVNFKSENLASTFEKYFTEIFAYPAGVNDTGGTNDFIVFRNPFDDWN